MNEIKKFIEEELVEIGNQMDTLTAFDMTDQTRILKFARLCGAKERLNDVLDKISKLEQASRAS